MCLTSFCIPATLPNLLPGIWDACNECDGVGLYESLVMPTVAANDASRPIWPSSPSSGWRGGVDRLTSRPNGKPLVTATNWGKVRIQYIHTGRDPCSNPRAAANPISFGGRGHGWGGVGGHV